MATVTWTGATDNAFSTGTNWDNGTGPAAADDVVFDGAFPVTGSANCTWDVTTDFNTVSVSSGYTGTITASSTVNVTNTTGSFTFDGNGTLDFNGQTVNVKSFDASGSTAKTLTMGATVLTSSGDFNLNGNSITFNYNSSEVIISGTSTVTMKTGVEFYKLTINGSSNTVTLGSDITVNATLNYNGDSGDTTLTSNKIFALGNIENTVSSGNTSGTTTIEFSGGNSQTWTTNGGALGNAVIINKNGGDVTLSTSSNVKHGGDFTYTAGTFGGGAHTYERTGTGNVSASGISFYDFLVSSGTTTVLSALDINNALTVSSGATLSGSSNVNVGYNVTGDGTISMSGGTFTTETTINFGGDTAWTFNNLALTGSIAVVTKTGSGSITVSNDLTTSDTTLEPSSSTWNIGGNFAATLSSSAGTHTFNFTATDTGNTIALGGGYFYNLTFNGAGGVWSPTNNNIDVNNALTITSGIFDLAGYTLTATGATFSNNDTLRLIGTETITDLTMDTNSGLVHYNGGSVTGLVGGNAYYDLQFHGTGSPTFTLNANLDVNGDFISNGSNTVDAVSYTINIAGDFAPTGTFTAGTSTVIFDGTSTLTQGASFYNLTLASGSTVHITPGYTFAVTNDFTATSCTLDSSTPSSQSTLNVTNDIVATVTATDIDSSGGNEVDNVGGTNTNTINWINSASGGGGEVSVIGERRKKRNLLGVGL